MLRLDSGWIRRVGSRGMKSIDRIVDYDEYIQDMSRGRALQSKRIIPFTTLSAFLVGERKLAANLQEDSLRDD